ncbi:MAG: RNA methyltransferase, partial [Lachnospiraceae bacterium]|nr:RNA methyltransferase [Lachnospiraceae bacterium]
GTIFQIPWTVLPETEASGEVQILRDLGFQTVAMALTDNTRDLGDPDLCFADRAALFFGAEGDGLRPETITACDVAVRIPMRAGIDSLNVAAASAVAVWEFMNV